MNFSFADESLDVDPNYDPSDFLKMSGQKDQSSTTQATAQYSLSVKQETTISQFEPYERDPPAQQQPQSSSYDLSSLPTYQPKDSQSQQQQPPSHMPYTPQQSEQVKLEGAMSPLSETDRLHNDLAISDSNEEEQNQTKPDNENDNENDDDGDGLWF